MFRFSTMLTSDQRDRLKLLTAALDGLSTETDEEGAAEILEAIYEFVTNVYDRYPTLDAEDEE